MEMEEKGGRGAEEKDEEEEVAGECERLIWKY